MRRSSHLGPAGLRFIPWTTRASGGCRGTKLHAVTSAIPRRPLLLLHSINAAASAYEMKPLFEHYSRERPVYALDFPGYGLSDRSARDYTPRLMTDAIHALAGRHPPKTRRPARGRDGAVAVLRVPGARGGGGSRLPSAASPS